MPFKTNLKVRIGKKILNMSKYTIIVVYLNKAKKNKNLP